MRRSLRSLLTRVERMSADLMTGGLGSDALAAILHAGRARNARGERVERSPEESRQRGRELPEGLRALGLRR